jgi:glucose dehydrogenase
MKLALIICLAGIAVTTVAVIALTGYAIGKEPLYHIGGQPSPPMALLSAIEFLLTGLGLALSGWLLFRLHRR